MSANSREVEWIELFRTTGSNEYFERLYKQYRGKVYGMCFRLLRDAAEAEDFTHEVFLRAYEKFHAFQGHNFSGWVGKIAWNLCANRIRDDIKRRRLLHASTPTTGAVGPEPAEKKAIQAEHLDIARQIISTLRPEHRKVFLLKYLEGFTYQEIETITGFTADQVRSHLQNARRNFQLRWQSRVADREDNDET